MSSDQITSSFSKYFYVTEANTDELKRRVFNVRYQVYVEEFAYEREEDCPGQMERDDYDAQSRHCLLVHKATGLAAGCVRLVLPNPDTPAAPLPFERFCSFALSPDTLRFLDRQRCNHGEFSRLAVISHFRRRKTDEKAPVSLPEPEAEAVGRDSFPFIPVSLFLAALCMLLNSPLDHGFAMMEPRLSRLLKRFGIVFDLAGEVVDYHGPRGPFLLSRPNIIPNLRPDVYELMRLIDQQLCSHAYHT